MAPGSAILSIRRNTAITAPGIRCGAVSWRGSLGVPARVSRFAEVTGEAHGCALRDPPLRLAPQLRSLHPDDHRLRRRVVPPGGVVEPADGHRRFGSAFRFICSRGSFSTRPGSSKRSSRPMWMWRAVRSPSAKSTSARSSSTRRRPRRRISGGSSTPTPSPSRRGPFRSGSTGPSITVHAIAEEVADGLSEGEMDRRVTWLEGGGE